MASLDRRKISPPTGIRSPNRPARSQSLHRLRYLAHTNNKTVPINHGTNEEAKEILD